MQIKYRYTGSVIYEDNAVTMKQAVVNAVKSFADLWRADLRCADLRCADLSDADLSDADLSDAKLTNTALSPANTPNMQVGEFEKSGRYIIGYRADSSINVGNTIYIPGERYTAPVFSTCSTACHPGIYLCPTIDEAADYCGYNDRVVKCRSTAKQGHKAGNKYRFRWIHVLEYV